MRRATILIAATLLAACGSQAETNAQATPTAASASASAPSPAATRAAVPDLAACPKRDPVDDGLRERTTPIAVPAALREVMRSDMDNFALTTLGGATTCVDASWMETIHEPTLSSDGRFAAFDWGGYEAYGHVIVDRAGRGQVVDTGVAPVASPSGRLLAAADLGEAGFGAFNAFGVWRIEPSGLRVLARQEEVPQATDWRIEGWAGEACVDLSAIPWEGYTGQADAPRERFRARDARTWRLEPGRCADA